MKTNLIMTAAVRSNVPKLMQLSFSSTSLRDCLIVMSLKYIVRLVLPEIKAGPLKIKKGPGYQPY